MPFSFLCTRRTRFYDPFYFKFGVSVFAFSFRSHLCKIRAQQIYTNTIFGKSSKASRAAVLFEWSMIKVTPAPRTVLSCINSKIASQAPPNAAQRSPMNLQFTGRLKWLGLFFTLCRLLGSAKVSNIRSIVP